MLNRTAIFFLGLITAPALADGFYFGAEIGVAASDGIIHADRVVPCGAGCMPGQVSLDGLHLDAEDAAWGLFAGWQFRNWLSFELAYDDLGEQEDELVILPSPLIVPGPLVVPELNSDYLSYGPPNLVSVPIEPDWGWAGLGLEEVSFNAYFRHALTERFSAWWTLGVSLVTFEASGYYEMQILTGLQPTALEIRRIPFATPDDETGYRWGFGAEYAFNDRFALQVGYRRHELQVIEVESLSLRFRVGL